MIDKESLDRLVRVEGRLIRVEAKLASFERKLLELRRELHDDAGVTGTYGIDDDGNPFPETIATEREEEDTGHDSIVGELEKL